MNAYVYGTNNGELYEIENFDSGGKHDTMTHWDPRVDVRAVAGVVQVGVVPPSPEKSTEEAGFWDSEDGQFLSLDWAGVNRLIRAMREARDESYGRPE